MASAGANSTMYPVTVRYIVSETARGARAASREGGPVKTETEGWTLASALAAIRKLWWLILGCAVIGGAAGTVVAVTTTPQYQSTASLYFAVNQVTSANDLNQGSNYTQAQMLSFAQLATSS